MHKINSFFTGWIIITLSVFLYAFIDKFSLPFIYTAYAYPVLYLLNIQKIEQIDIICFILMSCMIFFPLLHPENLRISTIFYGYLFIFTFLYYKTLLERHALSRFAIMKIIKYIIYAYTIIIIIQQLQIYVLHSTAFNAAKWQTSTNASSLLGGIKFNSLAYEASNVPLILVALMYAYQLMFESIVKRPLTLTEAFNSNKILWLCFTYTIITTMSLTATFAISIFLLRYYKIRFDAIIKIILAFILFIYFMSIIAPATYERFINMIVSLTDLLYDKKNRWQGEGSAGARIIPYVQYLKKINPLDINFYIGHGIDSFEKYLNNLIFDDIREDWGGVGNICNYLYNYGLITSLFLFTLLKKILRCKILSYDTLLYLLIYSVLTPTHIVFWLYVICVYTGKYYEHLPLKTLIKKKTNNTIGINHEYIYTKI